MFPAKRHLSVSELRVYASAEYLLLHSCLVWADTRSYTFVYAPREQQEREDKEIEERMQNAEAVRSGESESFLVN